MAKRKRSPAVPMLLPQPADQFVGRRAELNELVRALQPGQTVTLVGEPGIGKRALAAAAIDRLRTGGGPHPFPAGVVTLSCNQYPDEHLLLSALARALGAAAYPDLRATIGALLQGKRLLIVLEDVDLLSSRSFDESNYRQIALHADDDEISVETTDGSATDNDESALATLHALLDNGDCGILLTTTDPECVTGFVIELGPLNEAESRMLLAVYTEDVLDSLQDSTEIAHLLAGLPLALTLAGMWIEMHEASVADLREALAAELADLTPEQRREAGLAAIYRLAVADFDQDTQTTLLLLAMLAGAPLPIPMVGGIVSPFKEANFDETAPDETAPDEKTLAAALGSIEKGMSILADLVDSGLLVERDGSLQYRHHLLPQLALKQKDTADTSAPEGYVARLADMIEHLVMFAELAEAGDAALAPGLAAHLLHLQGMLYVNRLPSYVCDMAVRSARYFTLPDYWYELFDMTRLAHRAVRQLNEPGAVAEYSLGIGMTLMRLGFTHDAAATLVKAMEAAEESDDEEMVLAAAKMLIPVHMELGNWEDARHAAERLVELARRQDDDKPLLAIALSDLAQVLIRAEDQAAHLPRAIELVEEALALYHQLDDQENVLEAMLNASVAWGTLGNIPRALEYAEPAVELARRLRKRELETAVLLNLGEIYNKGGESRRALRTFEKALDVAQRTNQKSLIALSCWRLGNSVEQTGNGRAALKYYEQCLATLDPAEISNPTPEQVQAKIAALRGQRA